VDLPVVLLRDDRALGPARPVLGVQVGKPCTCKNPGNPSNTTKKQTQFMWNLPKSSRDEQMR